MHLKLVDTVGYSTQTSFLTSNFIESPESKSFFENPKNILVASGILTTPKLVSPRIYTKISPFQNIQFPTV